MAYEPKDGEGTLFIHDKQGNDKRPDRTGYLLLNGVRYKLAGWIKQSPGKPPFLSLRAQPEEQRQEQPPPQQYQPRVPQSPQTNMRYEPQQDPRGEDVDGGSIPF